MYKLKLRDDGWFGNGSRTDRIGQGMWELKTRLESIEPQKKLKDLENRIRGVGNIPSAFDGAPYIEKNDVYVPGEGMCPKIYLGEIVKE